MMVSHHHLQRKYGENSMEDNNIENNGFENFEDPGKYKSVSTIKEKQANVIGIFSMIFYVSGFILLRKQ